VPGPFTSNVGFIVPVTGTEVGTWGSAALNPDFIALDGLIGGLQTVSVSNAPVTLTSPASFTSSPSAGPTQSQNRILRFTGVLSADVRVTLPLPGSYIIENLTTGAFVLSFQGATATEVIGTPQGERLEIYNDGANVRFVGLGRVGARDHWNGLSAMPAWVAACTVKPYLLQDGTLYNISDYPFLGAQLGSKFGGDGVTTFGVPDTRGRMSLPYDGTGTRITAAGCGINGQTLGAALDAQTVTLTTAQLAAHTHANTLADPGHTHGFGRSGFSANIGGVAVVSTAAQYGIDSLQNVAATTGVAITNVAAGGGQAHNNVQPSLVTGIDVIKT